MDNSLIKFDNSVFVHDLTEWYSLEKRDLPWRKTKNPYHIWVSEIMLQQTKVDTVIQYYEAFMKLYPSIFDLAQAEEQEVLKVWEGLGYYSRARNLHQAAKEVVEVYQGVVPKDPKILGTLKGIGPYTKGAILSIAFGQPEPAVDGNVLRVLSRILYIHDNISEQRTRRRFEEIVRELIQEANPAIFNQALMELGALICTPKNPQCLLCPVKEVCRSLEVGEVDQLPVKTKKKKQRKEHLIALLIRDENGRIAIEQRPDHGLLANLWQFPMIDKEIFQQNLAYEALLRTYNIKIIEPIFTGSIKHVFSHIIWMLDVYYVTGNQLGETSLSFVDPDQLDSYPFSVAHQKVMKMLK